MLIYLLLTHDKYKTNLRNYRNYAKRFPFYSYVSHIKDFTYVCHINETFSDSSISIIIATVLKKLIIFSNFYFTIKLYILLSILIK